MNPHATDPVRLASTPPAAPSSSMCHVCFAEVPATVERRDRAIYMSKTCPAHGTSDVMVERDADFCLAATRHRGVAWTNSPSTIVEVTHRCNNRCPNCYHEDDRGHTEPGIDQVLGRVASIATPYICLVGRRADGSPRPSGPDRRRCTARGRHVSMYSNGIRLADRGYAAESRGGGIAGRRVQHAPPGVQPPEHLREEARGARPAGGRPAPDRAPVVQPPARGPDPGHPRLHRTEPPPGAVTSGSGPPTSPNTWRGSCRTCTPSSRPKPTAAARPSASSRAARTPATRWGSSTTTSRCG